MSISALFHLAKDYFFLGFTLLTLVAVIFLFAYFVVYKLLFKGRKKLKVKGTLLWSAFFIYFIVVLGATLGMRHTGSGGYANFHLFSSYIEAWNSFSTLQWRNIILNILMLVPLGIFLPLLFKKCKKFWVTYLLGFLFTLILELTQLFAQRGIFELDDILNNTLGCIIGYGVVMIFILYFVDKKKDKSLFLLSLQLPLLITIIGFSYIFYTYSNQELGNLSIKYSISKNMSDIKVNTSLKLNHQPSKAYVYKTYIGSKEDALELANNILKSVNSRVDEALNDVYDETIVYYSSDKNYSVWVNFAGLTTSFRDCTKTSPDIKSGLNYNELRTVLGKYKINLPEKAEFKEVRAGNYDIFIKMYETENHLLDGMISCEITSDNKLSSFSNGLITYEKYKEFDIISEKEAFNKILAGQFIYYDIDSISEINIMAVNIGYALDSKGFYQPVYEFTLKGQKENSKILIPALKH